MTPLPNLLYYSCVAKGTTVLADYADNSGNNNNPDIPFMTVKWLENIPPFHAQFSYTTSKQRFASVIDQPFVYCAMVDEALSKAETYAYLDLLREEVKKLLRGKEGFSFSNSRDTLAPHLGPIFRRLASPLVGIPQLEKDRIEEDSQTYTSPSSIALIEKKTEKEPSLLEHSKEKGKKHYSKKKGKEHYADKSKGKSPFPPSPPQVEIDTQVEQKVAGNSKSKGQQLAHRMWWRLVRLVLLLDFMACLLLFFIWLGVCKGLSCVMH